MPAPATCPDLEQLKRYALGKPSPLEVDSFARHLEQCTECAAQVETLLNSDQLAAAVREGDDEELGILTAASDDEQTGGQALTGDAEPLDFLAKADAADELGRLAHYRVLKELGRGGMGCVLLAEDTKLQRQVALKVLLPRFARDATAKERFLREARAAAKVHHDNVITIFQVDEANGVPFIALELLEGIPLDQFLRARGTLPVPLAVRIATEMAAGLAAAHARGLIHRDIKPANIWLETKDEGGEIKDDGRRMKDESENLTSVSETCVLLPPSSFPDSSFRVKVLDFGLARTQTDDTHLTQSGVIMGTPAFMAPEQARGEKVDGRCDLFSLGVVLYRMTTGRQPFAGPTAMAVLTAIAVDNPAPARSINPKIPEALEKIMTRLLEKDPVRRYASAKELIADLNGVLNDLRREHKGELPLEPDTLIRKAAATARIPPAAPGGRRSKRWPKIVAAALGFVAIGILAWQIVIRITDEKGNVREVEVKKNEKVEIIPKASLEKKKTPAPNEKEFISTLGVKFAWIPPGTFMMGSPQEELERHSSETQHRVTLTKGFYMGVDPITRDQFAAFVEKSGYKTQAEREGGTYVGQAEGKPHKLDPSRNWRTPGFEQGSDHPVVCVSWHDAVAFATWLGELEKKSIRLPTEAEWEYACRAGTTTPFYVGETISADQANYNGTFVYGKGKKGIYRQKAMPVGSFPPNAFGLHDMHGNVWQWCQDWHGDYPQNEVVDPQGPDKGKDRVRRGGSWRHAPRFCRAAQRERTVPGFREILMGFRVCFCLDRVK